ncbi:MAG: hypothetical protein V4635_08045 [Bacteroidota bacterium]
MQLLKLRYFQIKRDLSYWVIIIAAAVFYISREVSLLAPLQGVYFIGLISVLVYSYHLNRKDLNFLSKYFTRHKFQICINYNLLVLPASLAFVASPNWWLLFLLHFLVSLISVAGFKSRSFKLLFISRYIPAAHFEWISGVRKNFHLLCLLLVVTLILSPVKLFGLVALLLFNFIFLGFYNFFEPLVMLNPNHLLPKDFLRQKISFLSNILLCLNAPLLLINFLFNPEVLWFNLGFLFALLLLASCSVYIKYSNYRPNESLRVSVDFLVLTASIFFPYLIPLGLLIYFSSRKKAIANLANFTDDTH